MGVVLAGARVAAGGPRVINPKRETLRAHAEAALNLTANVVVGVLAVVAGTALGRVV